MTTTPLVIRFNPTLVRLRPEYLIRAARGGARFQSHAGSIEAHGGKPVEGRHGGVSIPRWFD